VDLRAAIEAEEPNGSRWRPGCPPSWPSATSASVPTWVGGAARLVGDRCEGCHLTLPSMELERIHHLSADTFATCPQCDRILVH